MPANRSVWNKRSKLFGTTAAIMLVMSVASLMAEPNDALCDAIFYA
jgi:hypothetical protein